MSRKKFESGTGWPSFNDPDAGSVETTTDKSYGMARTEVHCGRCGSHLGHVFDDGPPPTHLRYCINGVAMNFEKRSGHFTCAGCGQKLFVSKTKFESGTGWPSFNDPEAGAVEETVDRSYGMTRTEVHCSRCGSHLGHVFEDGPPPTHLRYCINGVALDFKAE